MQLKINDCPDFDSRLVLLKLFESIRIKLQFSCFFPEGKKFYPCNNNILHKKLFHSIKSVSMFTKSVHVLMSVNRPQLLLK